MASYYIRIDTYWQNSRDRFVGPFPTREAAQAEIDRAYEASSKRTGYNTLGIAGSTTPNNIATAVRVHGIISKTEARKEGMRESFHAGSYGNLLGTQIPVNMDELREIEESLYVA